MAAVEAAVEVVVEAVVEVVVEVVAAEVMAVEATAIAIGSLLQRRLTKPR
jgi:hypothetical protein